jgi:hypothetical protein
LVSRRPLPPDQAAHFYDVDGYVSRHRLGSLNLHFDRYHLHHHASSAWYDLTLQQQHDLQLRRLMDIVDPLNSVFVLVLLIFALPGRALLGYPRITDLLIAGWLVDRLKGLPRRANHAAAQRDGRTSFRHSENADGRNSLLDERLPKVATEVALHVLAYNLARVMNIIDIQPPDSGDASIARNGSHRDLGQFSCSPKAF